MWDFGLQKNNSQVRKAKIKLANAWIKYYTPMQLSQVKFRMKVNSRVRKGKFPDFK